MYRKLLVCITLIAAATLPAHAAGSVETVFIAPATYTDAGRDPADAAANADTLARHLRSLGERHLAPGQVLRIDVLDLDLAGTLRPARRGAEDIRVVRGAADWPRIKLRYSLLEGDRIVSKGEETIADLNYTGHGAAYAESEPLRHEKRLLSTWFKARFIDHQPPG